MLRHRCARCWIADHAAALAFVASALLVLGVVLGVV